MNETFEYVVWMAVATALVLFWLRLRRRGT